MLRFFFVFVFVFSWKPEGKTNYKHTFLSNFIYLMYTTGKKYGYIYFQCNSTILFKSQLRSTIMSTANQFLFIKFKSTKFRNIFLTRAPKFLTKIVLLFRVINVSTQNTVPWQMDF